MDLIKRMDLSFCRKINQTGQSFAVPCSKTGQYLRPLLLLKCLLCVFQRGRIFWIQSGAQRNIHQLLFSKDKMMHSKAN